MGSHSEYIISNEAKEILVRLIANNYFHVHERRQRKTNGTLEHNHNDLYKFGRVFNDLTYTDKEVFKTSLSYILTDCKSLFLTNKIPIAKLTQALDLTFKFIEGSANKNTAREYQSFVNSIIPKRTYKNPGFPTALLCSCVALALLGTTFSLVVNLPVVIIAAALVAICIIAMTYAADKKNESNIKFNANTDQKLANNMYCFFKEVKQKHANEKNFCAML